MKARILTPLIFAVLTFSCNQTEELKKVPDERKTYPVNDIIVETIEDSNTDNEPNNVPVEDTIRPAFEPNKPDKTKGKYVGTFDKGQRKNLSGFSTNDVLLKWTKALFDSVHFAENGDDIVVELDKIKNLLGNGANPNWINTEYKKPESVLHRHVDLVCLSEDPNTVQKGVQAIKLLFDHGAKTQYCDRAILFSPIADNQSEIVKLLLKNGANATAKIEGMQLIEWAAHYGSEEVYNLLMKHGAKPLTKKKKSLYRFICLAGGAYSGNIPKMNKLLEQGFSINEEDSRGEGALTEAVHFGWYNYERYIMVKYLLEKGIDVNRRYNVDGVEQPALHAAIYGTHFSLEKDASKYKKEETKNRIIEAQLASKSVLSDLIKAGARVSGRDANREYVY